MARVYTIIGNGMKLGQDAFERAHQFILANGRGLERALFRHHFEAPCEDEVVGELAKFQNADGGFGHALEPDFRLPESSVMATTVGLQTAASLQLDAAHPLVSRALAYLAAAYDPSLDGWPAVPPSVNEHPHAPWWHQDPKRPPDAKALQRNPGLEVAAYLIRWGHEDRESWARSVVTQTAEFEPHELLCCIRLAESPGLTQTSREELVGVIRRHANQAIETDSSQWDSYCIKPLAAAPSPQSLLAAEFDAAIQRQLDYEIAQQSAEGAWLPHWSWGDGDPAGWELSKRDWSAQITLETLRTLAAFERL